MKHRHPWLRRVARVAFYLFLVAVAVLLVRYARSIDWDLVEAAIRGYGRGTALLAAGLTVASYAVYACYDLGARGYAHHHLSTRRVAFIAFTSYAFALNIGALVGGRFTIPKRALAAMLAFAAGALITALTFELFEESYEKGGIWRAALGLAVGAIVFTLLNRQLDRLAEADTASRKAARSSTSTPRRRRHPPPPPSAEPTGPPVPATGSMASSSGSLATR